MPGARIVAVNGDDDNLKITTTADLLVAEALIERMAQRAKTAEASTERPIR